MLIKVADSETNQLFSLDGIKATMSSFLPNWSNMEVISTGVDFIMLKLKGNLAMDIMLDSEIIFHKL